MLSFCCFQCGMCVQAVGESSVLKALFERCPLDSWLCPRCDSPVKLLRGEMPEGFFPETTELLDAELAYPAVTGLGLPPDRVCTPEVVALTLAQPVKKAHGRMLAGTSRFVLTVLEMVDGTRVHFAAGPAGAVIHRITPPFKYLDSAKLDD